VPTVVIGTAGHIDHGKTALLRALTGIDADRLPEEQARGMTIEVGYAHLVLDDGVVLDFVDVPGHDRLIGNMLVGAGEIDAALLVVAADDGPRPQTVEHLQLLDALEIADGLVAITKVDLVDEMRVAEVTQATRALLQGTALADAPIQPVSAVTNEGIEGLLAALVDLEGTVRRRGAADVDLSGRTGPDGAPRLAIDRVFTVQGRGVVVTGSLRGGTISVGETLRREPGGEEVRVRGLQVHSEERRRHDAGRTALNVTGLPAEGLRRGDVLTADAGIRASERLLVRFRPPHRPVVRQAALPRDGARLRLHIGTDQVDAVTRRVPTVADALVLRLAGPTATFAGDRGVLREPAAGSVIAGVRVLDPGPPRGASRRRMTAERVERLAAAVEAGELDGVRAARVDLHGVLAPDTADPGSSPASVILAQDLEAELAEAALALVAAHHEEAPLSPGLPLPRARAALLRRLRAKATIERRASQAASGAIARLIDGLVEDGRLVRRGDALRDPSRGDDLPAALLEAMDRLEAALALPAPPPLEAAAADAGCPPDGVRALQADGRIVRIGPDLAWAAPTYHRLAALALELARAAPLTPAAFRDATDTSRRYVLAILEDLDRRGILERTPEGHIPGPRAPRRDAATVAAAS
jgi:selenocysteine-specific elongation factor